MATSNPSTARDGEPGGARGRAVATHPPRPSDRADPSTDAAVGAPFGSRLHVEEGLWILELSGECDMAAADELASSLADAEGAAQGRVPLVVDVSRLTFCDAHSAALILATSGAVRARPFGAQGIVKRVFDLFDGSGGPVPGPEERILDLQRRLVSRTVIGQAEGILMERHHITAPEAFARLRICSQLLNRKLREVARDLVETGQEPLPDTVLDERIARDHPLSARSGT